LQKQDLKGEQRAKRELVIKRIQEFDLIAESRLLSFLNGIREYPWRMRLSDYWRRYIGGKEQGRSGSYWATLIPTFTTNLPMVEGGRTQFPFSNLTKGRSEGKRRLLLT
jgi:hypothetical protein